MDRSKIMVVEDDREIRELVTMYLKSASYTVLQLESGVEVGDHLGEFCPDLIILDILLPEMNGIDVCKLVRSVSNVPILFLSCLPASHHVIAGLEAGGNDYVIKPFDPAVLLARVKAHLRRSGELSAADESKVRRYGDLEIHLDSLEVFLNGRKISLYSKELQLLLFFSEHPNIVFNARQLYERIWGWNSDGDERTVMVHISNLRKKIDSETSDKSLIQTVRGFGYKFIPLPFNSKEIMKTIITNTIEQ